jgi:hypothetical protein
VVETWFDANLFLVYTYGNGVYSAAKRTPTHDVLDDHYTVRCGPYRPLPSAWISPAMD